LRNGEWLWPCGKDCGLIPVAALSKTQVHGHFTDGIAGSNSAEGMDIRLLPVVCSVGSGLCGGLIIRPEDSYRVYVYLIV